MENPFASPGSLPKMVLAIIACNVFGGLGAFVTTTGPGTWYAGLVKPFFTPPGWVFAPVWITLFTLMGIALWLIWECGTERPDVRIALGLFGVQFVFNVLWSFLFFGLMSPFLALVDIVILWVLIVATIAAFYRVRKGAAYVLIPYICWVSLATALTYTIWVLNP
jgi:tryptophan-rich sensory protein